MRKSFIMAAFGAAVLLGGCATKKFVQQTVDPVQAKVNQVADQATKLGAQQQTDEQAIAKNAQAISATDEKATGADRRAAAAGTAATAAQQKADQDDAAIGQLRGVIANIDDYKMTNQAVVLFKVNSSVLDAEEKSKLDQLATNAGSLKRFFVAVEGHTDSTGPAAYNLELSKRRADSVVRYLSVDHNVPFYQIRTVGLGDLKLVDPGKTKDARAKNRRVEVRVYVAPDTTVAGR